MGSGTGARGGGGGSAAGCALQKFAAYFVPLVTGSACVGPTVSHTAGYEYYDTAVLYASITRHKHYTQIHISLCQHCVARGGRGRSSHIHSACLHVARRRWPSGRHVSRGVGMASTWQGVSPRGGFARPS